MGFTRSIENPVHKVTRYIENPVHRMNEVNASTTIISFPMLHPSICHLQGRYKLQIVPKCQEKVNPASIVVFRI